MGAASLKRFSEFDSASKRHREDWLLFAHGVALTKDPRTPSSADANLYSGQYPTRHARPYRSLCS